MSVALIITDAGRNAYSLLPLSTAELQTFLARESNETKDSPQKIIPQIHTHMFLTSHVRAYNHHPGHVRGDRAQPKAGSNGSRSPARVHPNDQCQSAPAKRAITRPAIRYTPARTTTTWKETQQAVVWPLLRIHA